MHTLQELLLKHRGKCASVNSKESEYYGWIVIDVEPLKAPAKAIFLIHEVADDMLVLDYFGMREMHYVPLDKIIKVNVILRER